MVNVFGAVEHPHAVFELGVGARAGGVAARFGLGQRPAAEPLAGRQLGKIAPPLLVAAHFVDVVGAERRVRGHDDAHRAIHAREFLDDDGVLDVAEPAAAQFFGEDRAHVAELAEFADDFEREGLRLVPLHDVRRDLGFGELPNGLAQLNLFRRVLEIHGVPALDDLFLHGVPADGALLPVAFHRHAAGDGDAEADLERAVGLLVAADGIEEVLHVRLGIAARDAGHFVAVVAVDLLRV